MIVGLMITALVLIIYAGSMYNIIEKYYGWKRNVLVAISTILFITALVTNVTIVKDNVDNYDRKAEVKAFETLYSNVQFGEMSYSQYEAIVRYNSNLERITDTAFTNCRKKIHVKIVMGE